MNCILAISAGVSAMATAAIAILTWQYVRRTTDMWTAAKDSNAIAKQNADRADAQFQLANRSRIVSVDPHWIDDAVRAAFVVSLHNSGSIPARLRELIVTGSDGRGKFCQVNALGLRDQIIAPQGTYTVRTNAGEFNRQSDEIGLATFRLIVKYESVDLSDTREAVVIFEERPRNVFSTHTERWT